VVHQVRRAFSHTTASATRAKPASLARERHQPIQAAPRTAKPRETASQRPATQELPELPLDESWHALALSQAGSLRKKRLEVRLHDLVEHVLGGTPGFVARGW
jgi:hypothetical protein